MPRRFLGSAAARATSAARTPAPARAAAQRQGRRSDRSRTHRSLGRHLHRSRRIGGGAERQAGVGLRGHLLGPQGRRGRLAITRRADRHRRRRPRDRLRARRRRRPRLRPSAVALHPRRRVHRLEPRRHQHGHPVRPAARGRLDLPARHRQPRIRQRHLDRDLALRRQRHLVDAHGATTPSSPPTCTTDTPSAGHGTTTPTTAGFTWWPRVFSATRASS